MRKLACLLMCLGAYSANADMGETQTSSPTTKSSKYHKAEVYAEEKRPFTGFYVSAGLGGTNAQFDTDELFEIGDVGDDSDEPFGIEFPFVENFYQNSAAAMIGLGYSYQFDMGFVLGLEVTANYTNAQVTNSNDFSIDLLVDQIPLLVQADILNTFKARLTNDFAILFKPGFMLTKHTQLYALVGPRWGNFKTSIDDQFTASIVGRSPFMLEISDEESGYSLGITAGAGIEQMLTDHLSVGLEYAWTGYNDIDSPSANLTFGDLGIGGFPPGDRLIADNADIDTSTNTVMLTLTYR